MRLRIILHHLAALLLLLNLWGCSDNVFTVLHGAWSSSERRMMETGNSDSAAVLLLRAKENGKVIESITQTGGNRSGWEIRFTDGTACRLIHAVFEDVTKDIQRFINSPSSYLYVDQDTMWCHIDPSTGMLARLSGAGECPATPAAGLHRMKSGAGAGLPVPLREQYNYTSGEETEDGYVLECCRVGGKDRCVRLVNSLSLHGLDCGRRAERVITTNLYWEWSHVRDYHLVATAIVENTRPHRVDIQKMSRSDNSGDALTGGYLAEVDTYYDEPVKFRSAVRGFPNMMHSPDSEDVTAEQVAYFQGYIGELEASLYDDERFARGEHRAYIDFDSFIRYWLVMELTYNSEISMPKSVWLYKDRLERLKLGPVWDFDYGTFRHVPRFCTAGTLYYNRLFSDDAFVERLSALWAAVRPELDRVAAYIDQLTDKMEVSAVANDALWAYAYGEFPVDDAGLSFREAAYALKQAYVERLQWLDEKITQRSFVAD